MQPESQYLHAGAIGTAMAMYSEPNEDLRRARKLNKNCMCRYKTV